MRTNRNIAAIFTNSFHEALAFQYIDKYYNSYSTIGIINGEFKSASLFFYLCAI